MAKVVGNKAGLVMDAFDLGSVAFSASVGVDVDTPEVTTFADLAKAYLEGDDASNWSLESYLDTGTDNWDDVAFSKVTTLDDSHYIMVEVPTTGAAHTAGNVVYEGIVKWKAQPRSLSLGEAITIGGDLQGTGPLARGQCVWTGAITATGNKTGVNMGTTAATQTLVATYRILAVSGSGSITFEIQESSDDGSGDAYAAISGTSSGAMTTTGVVQKTVTAATEAYKRLSISAYSGFTSVTALVTVSVQAL